MKDSSGEQIGFPKSSKLEKPHAIEGPMKEAKESFYELARSRVRILSSQEYAQWLKDFGFWGEKAGKSSAVAVIWPTIGSETEEGIKKELTHLEIVVNRDKFQIEGKDYSDLIPFVVEHELYESWLKAKKGYGDGSDFNEQNALEMWKIKHQLALDREFFLAEKEGLGDKLLQWHLKIAPEQEKELIQALEKARRKLERVSNQKSNQDGK